MTEGTALGWCPTHTKRNRGEISACLALPLMQNWAVIRRKVAVSSAWNQAQHPSLTQNHGVMQAAVLRGWRNAVGRDQEVCPSGRPAHSSTAGATPPPASAGACLRQAVGEIVGVELHAIDREDNRVPCPSCRLCGYLRTLSPMSSMLLFLGGV